MSSNYAAYYKTNPKFEVYVIELIVAESTYANPGTGSLELRPVIWGREDPSLPMTFLTKRAASKYLKDVLLEGESCYDIVGYSIKQVRTVQRKEAPLDEDDLYGEFDPELRIWLNARDYVSGDWPHNVSSSQKEWAESELGKKFDARGRVVKE